jgi:hypothetical protein
VVFEDAGERLPVGIRKLGMAHLKGLEKLPVYEIVDAVEIELRGLTEIPGEPLLTALDREVANSLESTGTWPMRG